MGIYNLMLRITSRFCALRLKWIELIKLLESDNLDTYEIYQTMASIAVIW